MTAATARTITYPVIHWLHMPNFTAIG